jgi:hypothetical protein
MYVDDMEEISEKKLNVCGWMDFAPMDWSETKRVDLQYDIVNNVCKRRRSGGKGIEICEKDTYSNERLNLHKSSLRIFNKLLKKGLGGLINSRIDLFSMMINRV